MRTSRIWSGSSEYSRSSGVATFDQQAGVAALDDRRGMGLVSHGERSIGRSASLGSAEFLLQPPDDVCDEIVESPADAVGYLLHARQPAAERWIQLPRLAAQQDGQLLQRRLHAAVEPLVNVPILVGESRAVLHIGQQQFRRAGEVAGGLAVIADGLARLAQLQFAKAPGGKELLHDLAPILLQPLAAALVGLTASLYEVAVHGGSFVKVLH